ncbi:unnamed protein product [Vicia faba]|uniref:Uncharacterized protein n=1 Tax=Vicia faba TaxID=3906 RepID=A0AAV0Z272_VICFA|nr:unnamed protein product [Vicia faba]
MESSGGGNLVVKLMPPLVLIKTKIEVACQRSEHVGHFVQIYQESIGHDLEIACHLECEGQRDVVFGVNPSDHHRVGVLAFKGTWIINSVNVSRYHWVAAKIVRNPFVLNTTKVIAHVNIIIGDMLNWVILPLGPDVRVCNTFEGCSIPLYECLFNMFGIHLLISNFEVAVLKHLKIPPHNFILEPRPSY